MRIDGRECDTANETNGIERSIYALFSSERSIILPLSFSHRIRPLRCLSLYWVSNVLFRYLERWPIGSWAYTLYVIRIYIYIFILDAILLTYIKPLDTQHKHVHEIPSCIRSRSLPLYVSLSISQRSIAWVQHSRMAWYDMVWHACITCVYACACMRNGGWTNRLAHHTHTCTFQRNVNTPKYFSIHMWSEASRPCVRASLTLYHSVYIHIHTHIHIHGCTCNDNVFVCCCYYVGTLQCCDRIP